MQDAGNSLEFAVKKTSVMKSENKGILNLFISFCKLKSMNFYLNPHNLSL